MVTKSSGDDGTSTTDVSSDAPSAGSGASGGTSGGGGGVSLPSWKEYLPQFFVRLYENPLALLASLIVGGGLTYSQAKDQIAEKGFLTVILDHWLFENILLPIAEGVWGAGLAFIDAILIVLYGADRQIGVSGPQSVGLVDIPLAFSEPFLIAIDATIGIVVGIFEGINQQIATAVASQVGIAAPPIVAGVWALEIAGLAWLIWVAVRTIDIPVIDETQYILAITRPIRNFIRWLT